MLGTHTHTIHHDEIKYYIVVGFDKRTYLMTWKSVL